ncbi:hypothetical protein, partial [Thiocapsa sp. C2-2m]|uniref:hypothetical protein n=1 Tax=Thiocapsa sp. C2-2m TaxID=3137395 RepID=UPI0035AEBC41
SSAVPRYWAMSNSGRSATSIVFVIGSHSPMLAAKVFAATISAGTGWHLNCAHNQRFMSDNVVAIDKEAPSDASGDP